MNETQAHVLTSVENLTCSTPPPPLKLLTRLGDLQEIQPDTNAETRITLFHICSCQKALHAEAVCIQSFKEFS